MQFGLRGGHLLEIAKDCVFCEEIGDKFRMQAEALGSIRSILDCACSCLFVGIVKVSYGF